VTSRTDIINLEPLAYSLEDVLIVIPTSHSQLGIWLASGELRSVKAGRRTWVLRVDLIDFLSRLPARETANPSELTTPESALASSTTAPEATVEKRAPMMTRRIPPSTHIQSPPARRPLRKR
jgi:hypothetical protein